MTAYFVLRTPSGTVRFRVNTEARDYEAVLVREEETMTDSQEDGLLDDVAELKRQVRELQRAMAALLDERHHHLNHVGHVSECSDVACDALWSASVS